MSLALFALTFVSIGLASPLVATPVETTADLTQISDNPAATLSKRHDYAMWCPGDGLQAYCQNIGYYCSATGKLTHRNRRDSRCARGCSCVNLGPAPVPCLNQILGFCNDVVDEAEAGGNETVVNPTKPLATETATANTGGNGTVVSPTKTLVTATATLEKRQLATTTEILDKRHSWAMDCGLLKSYCNQKGYYCDSQGLLAYQFDEWSTCNTCKCIDTNPVPKPLISVKPCINVILGFCRDVDETEAGVDAVESGEAV